MKIHAAQQGTDEWLAARLGVPTSSQFSRILSPAKLKPSASASGYAHDLLAEWLTGLQTDTASSAFMQRGTDLEHRARDWYAVETDTEPVEVGLCLTDDGCVGASPDAMVGDDGLLEIKCPSAARHIGYLLDGPGNDYTMQIQGQLWVTGRSWCDFLTYNPSIAPRIVRIDADPVVAVALSAALKSFVRRLQDAKDRLRGLGCVPACERAPMSRAQIEGIERPPTIDEMMALVGPRNT